MIMRRTIVLILIIALSISMLAGCDSKPTEIIKPLEIGRGEVTDGVYTNKDMGISIEVPEGYYIATEEELETSFDITHLLEDEDMVSYITYLAFFSLKPIDDAENNSHIMISVEDASKYGYSDKDTYIEYMAYEKSSTYESIEGAEVTVSNHKNVWLSNRKFAYRSITLDMDELYMVFDMYGVIKNGYFLTIMIGAFSDDDLDFLRGYLDTFVIE
jgi:hypothetical protein